MTENTEETSSKASKKRPLKQRLAEKCRKLKEETLTLYLSFFEIPWYKKILPFLVVCYAVSPLDLFPDFIPVLGMLDDFLLVPLGIWLCRKIIPDEVWAKNKSEVQSGVKI